jgi:predicted lipoprotein
MIRNGRGIMKKKMLALMLVSVLAVSATGCVKVVKIGEEGALTGKVEFNASDSVSNLWEEAEANIEEKAVELTDFLTEAGGDLKSLADKYGKYSMGTSGSISYAVKGIGTVEEVNQEKKAGYMTVKLDGYDGPEVIKIQIGSIYKGSSTRDSLDIIDFGNYTNQEEWAAISQELHAQIDANVVQPADPANLKGKTIEFVGTFTENGNDELLITAVKLEVK